MKIINGFKLFIFLILSVLLLLSSPQITHAASPTYGWTKTFGSTGFDQGRGVLLDSDGNLYTTGLFNETVNFDTTGGTDNHTSNGGIDIYITKYNADDSYAWTRTFGGSGTDLPLGIEADASGNVYVTGNYKETVNFDGTGGTDNHTSNGGADAFVTKYNSNGSYGWTRTFGGASSSSDSIYDIRLDSNNNLYLGGVFYATADFDPSAGVDNHTSNGNGDAFVSKHNSDGSYAWTRTWGGGESGSDSVYSIVLDEDENLIACGDFGLTVDFDDTGGTDNHTANGVYDAAFVKYNSDGSYGWTKTFGGTEENTIRACALDSSGNYFLVGWTNGAADFDNTSGTDIHTSAGVRDIFITKYNSDFSYGWTNVFGSAGYDWANSIAIDSLGNIFVAGNFTNTIDFDPTAVVENHTANASIGGSGFIIKYNSGESYGWTVSFDDSGVTQIPSVRNLFVDESGNFYTTGLFNGNVDFDISAGVDVRSATSGSYDAFLSKLGYDITGPSPNIVTPSGFSNNDTQPTLIFKKAVDTGSGMVPYSVNLDNEKERSFSVGGIPADGNGAANNLFRDDDTVRVEFVNEQDSDTNNDEISVYFKDLNGKGLTEGQHTWEVISNDVEVNQTSSKTDFYLDFTSPTLTNLSVSGVSGGRPEGDTTYITPPTLYRLDPTQRTPMFSGRAHDAYIGSTRINDNGTTDTFPSVSSGPKTLTLTFSTPNENSTYDDYRSYEFLLDNIQDDPGNEKYSDFYLTTPHPLEDGYYKVNLTVTDGAGNSYDYDEFFLTLNYTAPAATSTPTTEQNLDKMELEVVDEQEISTETDEETKQIEKEGVTVKVKVVDNQENPVEGAKVTLYSNPKIAYTNTDGIATFENIEKGEHKVEVEYDGKLGEESLNLTGDEIKEFDITIKMEPKSKVPPLTTAGIIVASAAGGALLTLLIIKRKRSS